MFTRHVLEVAPALLGWGNEWVVVGEHDELPKKWNYRRCLEVDCNQLSTGEDPVPPVGVPLRAELVSCCGITAEDAADIGIANWVGDTSRPRLNKTYKFSWMLSRNPVPLAESQSKTLSTNAVLLAK